MENQSHSIPGFAVRTAVRRRSVATQKSDLPGTMFAIAPTSVLVDAVRRNCRLEADHAPSVRYDQRDPFGRHFVAHFFFEFGPTENLTDGLLNALGPGFTGLLGQTNAINCLSGVKVLGLCV